MPSQKPRLGLGNIKLGKLPTGGKDGGGGGTAQLLHEQQLRILASLYGAPLRIFGVPPSTPPMSDPAESLGGSGPLVARPGSGGPPAGNALAVAKAARESAGAISAGDDPAPVW